MRTVLVTLSLVGFLTGCRQPQLASPTSTTRPGVGSHVTWQGVAVNHKVGAFLTGPGIYVDVADTHWPSDVVGKTVEVRGVIVERHDLPVFIADSNEPPVQGIPMPPGTDLHKASKRYILEQVSWKVVPGGG
jgi:hypothetical protein